MLNLSNEGDVWVEMSNVWDDGQNLEKDLGWQISGSGSQRCDLSLVKVTAANVGFTTCLAPF